MANLNRVVYLSEEQKNTLFSTGSVTSGTTTITYNDNDIYITPQEYDSSPTSGSNNLMTSGAIYNAISNAPGYNKVGTVTSVQVQATSPVVSSSSAAASTSLSTTISLADGYGDTKNPYAAKTSNYVLAGPSSGTATAVPTFRALVAADIPSLGNLTNAGKISTTATIANGDKLVIVDSDSTAASKITGSSITFDGSTTTKALTQKGTWETFLQSHQSLSAYAPLASPALTGTPTAPTPAATSNDTTIATTAFVKSVSGAYLPLSGGTMSGGVTFVGNQSSAWNSEGILFTKGSRIGENTSGQLGLYSADKFYLRPNSGTTSSGKGVEISTTSLIPSVNNEMALGDSDHRWANVYSTKYSTITQSAGYTNGIRFINGSTDMASIGCDNTGILGIYAKSKITLRPVVNTATDGIEINTTSMIPTKNNTVSLGDSTHKWSNIYGVGSNITALNASNISTGTLPLARLAATSAHYVLAGPSSGTATATPAFRALVADDIPSLTKSKISDFPTNVSAFTNDSGYLTSYTETDPTVPSWAKAASKPSYTASEVGAATTSHTHGNLTNDGKITTTATIASGDKIVIVDSDTTAASKITGSSITFGTSTTTFLSNKGTWETPAGTYSLPLAASGTRGGIQIGYSESGNNYAVKLSSEKAYVTVPWTDTKVTQNNTTAANDYRILLSTSANDTAETNTANKNTNLRYNPSTNTLSTGNISGSGNLTITGNTNLNGETYAESITAGSLLVNGNANFVQSPTAPTPIATSNDTTIATTAFVMNAFTANDAMVFKGVVNANGNLPATHKQGWTYRVATAGTYAGKVCEVGDIIICVTDGTAANNDHWAVIQNNVDGAVYRGTNAFTDANIIVADSTNGKVKSSGKTITTTAPSSSAADTTIPTSKAVWGAISGASGYGKTGTVTSITLKAGLGISLDTDNTAITTTGTRTITNAGVRATTINGNYLRVNTNGTNADLTIPYATKAEQDADGFVIPSTYVKLVAGTNIPASSATHANLNALDWQKTGSYCVSYNGNIPYIDNLPSDYSTTLGEDQAFMMNVYAPLSSDGTTTSGNWLYRIQEIIPFNNHIYRWRRLNFTNGSGTWSFGAWTRQVLSDNNTVTTVTTTGTGNAITAISASNGAITATKGSTFLTSHQDISGKADKSATVSTLAWDSTNKKITKTINGTTTDVVQFAAGSNVTLTGASGKLTIAATNTDTKNTAGSTDTTSKIFLIGATSQADNPQTYSDSEIYVQNGTLYAVKTQDLSGTANNKPAVIVGGADTSTHMEIDANEIQAKTNGTSVAQLYINNDGGLVTVGSGGLAITSLTASQAVSTDANKKLVSTNLTVSDPTASGTGITYIATISQGATGKITATKSTVRSASTSQTGVTQYTEANTNTQLSTLTTTWTATPTDDTLFIRRDTGGGATFGQVKFSTLWNYIKGKITAGTYWANIKISDAAKYNAAPEMATLKLNGNTSATAASTSNVTLVYDSTNQALNFVFA